MAQENLRLNGALIGANGNSTRPTLGDPPKATPARRAQSYTDFHYAVKAVLGKGSHRKPKVDERQKDVIDNDLDFADWYDGMERDLLEANQDVYQ
jgi:hypothetical protein